VAVTRSWKAEGVQPSKKEEGKIEKSQIKAIQRQITPA
jgi:hypothetical protein